MRTFFPLFILCLFASPTLQAEVKMPNLFTDHMVIQRDVTVPVWGQGQAGESVTVKIAGQSKETIVTATGAWLVKLDPLSADGPHELVISGSNSITIKDVLIGDVWLCSGQSNMNIPFGQMSQPIENREQEMASATFPQIRHFGEQGGQQWLVCSPETIKKFTAVGYAFGRAITEDQKVPIGLLHASRPGSKLSGWVRKEIFIENFPTVTPQLERFSGKTIEELRKNLDQTTLMFAPVVYFEHKIHPLIPFGIKGAIWFQGECGAGLDLPYGKLFQLMIKDWRTQWGQGEFPFYFVQVGNRDTAEGQASALQLPNTGMAIINDISFTNSGHPAKKMDIGKRLALLALGQTYGRDIETSGPLFQTATVKGNAILVTFSHTRGGLTTKNLRTSAEEPCNLVTIAGENKTFFPAEIVIEGNTIIASSPKVPQPVAVRYGQGQSNVCEERDVQNTAQRQIVILINKAGLPTAPFRSDHWPIEEPKKMK